jgi:hypothetical protein
LEHQYLHMNFRQPINFRVMTEHLEALWGVLIRKVCVVSDAYYGVYWLEIQIRGPSSVCSIVGNILKRKGFVVMSYSVWQCFPKCGTKLISFCTFF